MTLVTTKSAELAGEVLRIEQLGGPDIARWNDLMSADPNLGTPFLSYGYAAAAAKIFHGVRILRISSSGRTVGFFAFQFRSRLHRLAAIAERVSGELSDYFGLVAEPGLRLSASRLLQLAGLKAMLFTHLDESQITYGLVGEKPEPGLRIRLAAAGGAFWEQLRARDKKFVADTERRERKLAQAHGPLRFVFRDGDPVPELHKLIAAKRAQYRRTAVEDPIESASIRDFLELLAASQDVNCRAVLSTLHAGETWVASLFGHNFLFRKRCGRRTGPPALFARKLCGYCLTKLLVTRIIAMISLRLLNKTH